MSFLNAIFGGGGGGGGSVPPGVSKGQANDAIGGLSRTGGTAANFMRGYGETGAQGLNTGLAHLTPVSNWFQTIMNGNKQATLQQLQPQIQQVREGLATGLKTANTLTPRGGGRGEALFEMPFEGTKQIAQQYGQARAAAPAGLQSAATAEGALGSAAAGAGAEFGGVGAQANNALLNYGLNQQQQAYRQAQQSGAGFARLISPFLKFIPGVGPILEKAVGGFGGSGGGAGKGN